MKFYKDYVDDYSDDLVEKLNIEYSKSLASRESQVAFLERNEYYNEKQLFLLNQKLILCNNALKRLSQLDNKSFLQEAIEKTENNCVAIASCCGKNNDWDCLYYSSACPEQNSCRPNKRHCRSDNDFCCDDFNICCGDYCDKEWEVVNQLLLLLTIKNLPISHLILFDMLKCRTSILQKIHSMYIRN